MPLSPTSIHIPGGGINPSRRHLIRSGECAGYFFALQFPCRNTRKTPDAAARLNGQVVVAPKLMVKREYIPRHMDGRVNLWQIPLKLG
jgi:hypothetical protein